MTKNYEEQTQNYATFGDKLLQHLDVLKDIQEKGIWRPVMFQLSPTGACEFNCEMCSVKYRDKTKLLPFDQIEKAMRDFKDLGAKAVEITGGGNPLLYPKINEVIDLAHKLGFDIGLISNSPVPSRFLKKESVDKLTWYRASLSGLDLFENIEYDFSIIPKGILGFSYILNNKTTEGTIKKVADLVDQRPDVKFVRIAPDCLDRPLIKTFKKKWGGIIDKINESGKFFLKEMSDKFLAYPDFCGIGLIRPYCTEDGNIYVCNSYLLRKRKYEDEWIIGHITDVKGMYKRANKMFKETRKPYKVNIAGCYHCLFSNNNKILHTIIKDIKDKNFA